MFVKIALPRDYVKALFGEASMSLLLPYAQDAKPALCVHARTYWFSLTSNSGALHELYVFAGLSAHLMRKLGHL